MAQGIIRCDVKKIGLKTNKMGINNNIASKKQKAKCNKNNMNFKF